MLLKSDSVNSLQPAVMKALRGSNLKFFHALNGLGLDFDIPWIKPTGDAYVSFEYAGSFAVFTLIDSGLFETAKLVLDYMGTFEIPYLSIGLRCPLSAIEDLQLTEYDLARYDTVLRTAYGMDPLNLEKMNYRWMKDIKPEILFPKLALVKPSKMKKIRKDCEFTAPMIYLFIISWK